MKKIHLLLLILVLPLKAMLFGQARYEISKTHFSTNKYDEFCPVLYKDHVVFCSNQEDEVLITYQNGKNKGLINLFQGKASSEADGQDPEIFSRNLITPFNDGPASFSPDGKMVVYSRNMDIRVKTKNIFDLSNNLGLFFAEFKDDEWQPSGAFSFNNPEYSITSPCFSPDGRFLYFASDMPGGFGGTDIYRSEIIDSAWSEPVNLGEIINTKGNEVYPFIAENGDLFFASDGHAGFGKKDIFLSRLAETIWITPVHLEAPINSEEDDFGLITNLDFTEGYMSSNRGKTDDIFHFNTLIPQLFNCDTMLENNYCFEFWDDEYEGIDSLPVVYEWMFSDGTKQRGLSVEHCLPGPGKHWAKLNIIDNSTSNTFFTQTSMEFELSDHVQAFIASREAAIAWDTLEFSGLKSNVPDLAINEYVWDFGDGYFAMGPEVGHPYQNTGVYTVKLGLKGILEGELYPESRCVQKDISIFKDNQSLAMFQAGIEAHETASLGDSLADSNEIQQAFSVFDVDPEEEVFRVEVLASEEKVMLEDTLFDPLREQYEIKEFYLANEDLYSYTVGEFNALLNTYSVYNDVVKKGFSSASVNTYVVAQLPTEIIAKINKDFADFADANFEFNQSEVAESSYSILDRVATIMKENPGLVMEIAAHTDNVGSFEFNLDLSEKRAQSIVQYLVSKGIDPIRLVGNGYGESRPIAGNDNEDGRMANRRVEFIILNE